MCSIDCGELGMTKLLKITCGQCKLHCAVGPVSKDEDTGCYYCGRCRPEAEPNNLFEEAARKVLFPCRFGCQNQLAWEQVLNHEIVCKKRTILCPFVNCDSTQQLNLSVLPDHIKTQHPSFCQKSQQWNQLNLGSLNFMIRLHCIFHKHYTFLFFIKFERSIEAALYYFNFDICLLWPQNFDQIYLNNFEFKLDVKIPIANVKITKSVHGKDIKMYHERQHCLSCLYQTCDKVFHKNKSDWLTDRLAIFAKSTPERDDIFYAIEASKQERVIDIAPDNLECPVCIEYMTDQVYLCQKGHSICEKCKRSQVNNKCPTCREIFYDSRNYTLEKLIKSMKIACRRSSEGCYFTGTVASVKIHEKSCK